MTSEQFIQWLDEQILDNELRMDKTLDIRMSAYYLGCTTAISHIKEKFISVSFEFSNNTTK